MVYLKDIERNLKGLDKEGIKGRLSFYLQYITEMIAFSVEEMKEAKDDKIFFGEIYKNNFMDIRMRKLASETLEFAEEDTSNCSKEIKHYTQLKEIVKNLLKETNGKV